MERTEEAGVSVSVPAFASVVMIQSEVSTPTSCP